MASEDEYTRVHSYIEYLLEPERLEDHCEKLKSGKEKFPTGHDLIRTFLKEAHKSVVVHSSASNTAGAPTASLRAAALGELAAKVVDLLDISIEELETEVPPKYQRLLMDSLSATTNVPNGEQRLLKVTRWIVRAVTKKMDPACIFVFSSSNPHENQIKMESEIQQAVNWLTSWANNQHSTSQVNSLVSEVEFDLGEYHFSKSNWEAANTHFSKCQQVIEMQSTKCNVDKNRLDGFLFVLEQLGIRTTHIKKEVPFLTRFLQVVESKSEENILQLLSEDNSSRELPWEYRVSLETSPSLSHRAQQQVIILNIVRYCTHRECKVAPVFSLNRLDKDQATLGELLNKLLGLVTESTNEVFGINKENLEAIRSVLGNEGSFVEYAFEFLRMEKEVRLSLDQKASTKSHGLIAFGQIENVPFLDQKIDPSVPHNDLLLAIFSNDMAVITNAVQRLDKLHGSALANRLLLRRVRDFLDHGDVTTASTLIERVKPSTEAEQTAYTAATLIIAAHKCAEKGSSEIETKLESSLTKLLESAHLLLASELANVFEQLFSALINGSRWNLIQRLLNILRNTSHLTATIPQLQLVEALTSLLVWVESPGEDKMDVDNNEQNPATYFDTFILVATSQPTIGALHSKAWNRNFGLLYRLRNPEILQRIAGLLHSAALFVRQTKLNQGDGFSPNKLLPQAMSLWSSSPHITESKYLDSPSTTDIDLVNTETLHHLLHLNPNHYDAALTLGDVYYRLGNYRRALKFYFVGGSLESSFWSEFGLPDGFASVLNRIIASLVGVQDFGYALVLSQFANPIDYTGSFELAHKACQEQYSEMSWLKFVWEMPILEVITNIFAKAGNDAAANSVVSLIAQPELNEHANPSARKKHIHNLKRVVLTTLTKKYAASSERH